jgi:pimeloyl-ACP methyl ester carboxylesterase
MSRAVVFVLALLLSACGSSEEPAPETAPSPSASPTPTPTPTEEPWRTLGGPLGRCGPQPSAAAEAGLRYRVLRDPAVGRVPSVAAGRGRTVAVLLHQTDGNGLCGWLEHVPALTGAGVAVLAIDLCQYGGARCARGAPATDAVALAVAHARRAMHADRVVLVGASMGGSVALMAAATLDGIDAAVDLSGPVDWPGMEQVRGGAALKVPVLVAMADDEGADQVRGARRIVAHAPAGSAFLPAGTGHGYDLLAPLGPDVLGWVASH